jgi:hypothetical protein
VIVRFGCSKGHRVLERPFIGGAIGDHLKELRSSSELVPFEGWIAPPSPYVQALFTPWR